MDRKPLAALAAALLSCAIAVACDYDPSTAASAVTTQSAKHSAASGTLQSDSFVVPATPARFASAASGQTVTQTPALPPPKLPTKTTSGSTGSSSSSGSSSSGSSSSGSSSSGSSSSSSKSGSSSSSSSKSSSSSGSSSGSGSSSSSKSGSSSSSGSSSTSSSSGNTIYGVHDDVGLWSQSSERAPLIQYALNLHAKIARSSFKWSDIESSQGSYDWSAPDGAVSDLEAAGIIPLFTMWGSPSWINGSSDFAVVPTSASQFASWVSAYASFASAAAARYKGRVKYWELWNEENISDWWKPSPNLSQYLTWYKAVYAAIKAADPSANVGMGGITNLTAGATTDINGKTFLTGMYQAGVFPDAVVIHPYAPQNQNPTVTLQYQNNFTDVAMIHNIMTSYGQSGKQLWLTEWGWQSDAIGESEQASYTATALNMIATQYTYVTLSTIYCEQDASGNSWGLYTTGWSLKPAGSSFQSFAGSH